MKKSFLKFIRINLGRFSSYQKKNSSKINWSKKIYNKKNLEDLYEIKLPIKKNELEKIIRATSYKKFKPFIILNGYKFILTT